MFRQLITVALLIILSSCAKKTQTVLSSNGNLQLVSSGLQVGVKTAEQLAVTMSALTGVPKTQNNIQTTFNNLRSQLPSSNELSSFQSSHQLAVTKLATEYCDVAFNDSTIRSGLMPGLNFSQNPSQAYALASTRTQLINSITEKFWGKGLTRAVSATETTQTLNALIDDLLVGAPSSSTGTLNIAKGLCTAVLASTPVVLL